jgi:hypothetical protein
MTLSITTLVVLALAVYRVCRLIIQDTVAEKLRVRIWDKYSVTSGIGYLITCYWCTSIWVASLFVGMYTIVPVPTLAVSYVLALSAVVGIVAARVD